MIRLEGVTKRYGSQLAVRNLTIEFPTGQLTMLVGPSGCGKTTTLKMINRLIEPTEGRIFHDEQDVTHIDPVMLRLRMGYVIQNVGLFPHMTIADNIATVPRLIGWDRSRISQRVDELLHLVGLEPRIYGRRYPHQLSGGQRQRVGVARALGADPPVLLMDEPFGAIDRIARERLQNEFIRIQREVRKTVIFVTHDIDEAIKLGDRIAIMNLGQLVQYDTPAAILAKPANDLVIDLLGPDRGLKRLSVTPIDLTTLERPPVVHPDDALAAARNVPDGKWSRLVVLDRDDRPVGELDRSKMNGDGRVADRLEPLDAVVPADRTLYDAFSQMLIHHARWVAVVDGDRFCGVLTPEAFVAAIQRVPAEVEGASTRR
ncbi:MAG TPA: ATP-binding cassette domain-containing protein [Candidatus Dormibacteraeota bacterium]|jgi:osmoprotectant transport system ATP-binding protein|nr:ATP-binding cassette domain-containing protein [Candidatus Dormibacteraeota bacterium]